MAAVKRVWREAKFGEIAQLVEHSPEKAKKHIRIRARKTP
jgi:hypothetical protein